MRRKIMAMAFAATLAIAVGIAGASPASADGEIGFSTSLNRCSIYTSGGTGQCFFTAIPDTYNTLYLNAPYGYGRATVTCDGLVIASISTSSSYAYSWGWTNPGGACYLTVYGWYSTWASVY